MRSLVVCIHDAAPAYARETRTMIRDLAPMVGRRLSFAVVPDWHGVWPLQAHPDYCRLVGESSDEILLHGYLHRRQRGRGITTLLTGGSDEMNGLGTDETRRALERGQHVLTDSFGKPARGFLAPAWQRGQVRAANAVELRSTGLEYALGFLSLESFAGLSVPLATYTWDCGRWGWLGHLGHGVGSVLRRLHGRVPVLAIHPRDLERGFWPQILHLTRDLIGAGYEPTTAAALLEAGRC